MVPRRQLGERERARSREHVREPFRSGAAVFCCARCVLGSGSGARVPWLGGSARVARPAARRRHVRVLGVHGEPHQPSRRRRAGSSGRLRPHPHLARRGRWAALPARGLDRLGDDGRHRRRVRRGGCGAGARSDLRAARSTPTPRRGASSSPRSASAWRSAWRPTNQVAKFVDRGFAFVWALVAAAGALFVLASMPNLLARLRRHACGSARSAASRG